MSKGEQTRATILDAAIALASQVGLEGLSIGALAERTKLSKSGLFAHFGSKEEMQLAILDEAERRFSEVVVRPALNAARGLPRLRAIFLNWLDWTQALSLPGGCLLMAASIEFDDRPGPLRDAVSASQQAWRNTLADTVRKAIAAGHLAADADPEQIAFELVGIVLVNQQAARLLGDKAAHDKAVTAFERLMRDNAGSVTPETPTTH